MAGGLNLWGEGPGSLAVFYIVAPAQAWRTRCRITPRLVRRWFGGTIWPAAGVVVESLRTPDRLLTHVRNALSESPVHESEKLMDRWLALLAWFRHNRSFRDSAYVEIGHSEFACTRLRVIRYALRRALCGEQVGSVFPRLIVGLTEGDSLAGICGQVVQT